MTATPMKPALARRALKLGETLVVLAAMLALLGAIAFFAAPRVLGWQGVIVLTGSMEPALETGGLAFVDKGIDASGVKPGDIITYRDPEGAERNITHRLVGISRDANGLLFETRGDANDQNDAIPVPESYLVGRVVLHIPEVGNISNWVRQKENLYLLLWLPAGLIISGELLHIGKSLRTKKDLPGHQEAAS